MSNNTNTTNNSNPGVASKLVEIITSVLTADNVQTYMLGTKKNGKPRAIYDIVKSETTKKKKKKKKQDDTYSLYLGVKKKNKKNKKKGKKKDKYWKFD